MQDALSRAALAALTLTLAACSAEDAEPDREAYDLAIAGDAYKSWATFPNAAPELYPSAQHNGDFVRSYMNDVAAASLASFSGEFPDGSILVKEQYADAEGKTLNGHTVMWKREGYDPEHGDWYWIAFNGAGETTVHNGMAEYCYGCHASATANDWVYTPFK
jgi:CubicO group peptidase (beta-lactamase class C family)